MFVNRDQELLDLRKRYDSPNFELMILYGRRRIGKSRLVLESIKTYPNSVYFLATEQDEKMNIKRFKEDIARSLKDNNITSLIDDWELIFKYIAEKTKIIIIDEFPYLLSVNQKIKSIFQRIIDLYLVQTDMTLILMGSSIAMMVNEVLSAKSPLYGRRTGQMRLPTLKLKHIKYFFPNYSFEDLIQTYAVTGGIPYYLNQFDNNKSLWENISEKILNNYSVLFAEGEFLLKQEFNQISTYTSIIQQIAAGRTGVNEIKTHLSNQGDISSYLKNLKEIELIERRVPLFENPIKSRKGRYYLKDNYLNFWFRYVFPNMSDIISGRRIEVLEMITNDFSNYMGRMFEGIIEELLVNALVSGTIDIPFKVSTLGRWWYKDLEFDLIGNSGNNFLFVEIKWKTLNDVDIEKIFLNLSKKVIKSNFIGKPYYLVIAKKAILSDYKLRKNQIIYDLSMIESWIN